MLVFTESQRSPRFINRLSLWHVAIECVIYLEGIFMCFQENTLSVLLWLFSRYLWRSAHPVVPSVKPPAGHFSLLGWFPLPTGHKSEHPARKTCLSLTIYHKLQFSHTCHLKSHGCKFENVFLAFPAGIVSRAENKNSLYPRVDQTPS